MQKAASQTQKAKNGPHAGARIRRTLRLGLGLMLGLLSPAAHADTLKVFAAASLTDAMTELGREFDAQTGHTTRFQFAGSQTLRRQLEQGAQADIFASANQAQLMPLVLSGRLQPALTFAHGELAVAARKGGPVQQFGDIAKRGVRLVVANENVPAGAYTEALLEQAKASKAFGPDFVQQVRSNVVSRENNVRQVALKVALGEADAAFVYASDLTPSLKQNVQAVSIPPALQQRASYPIAVVRGSQHSQAANDFIQFVRSPAGQNILRRWGFQPYQD